MGKKIEVPIRYKHCMGQCKQTKLKDCFGKDSHQNDKLQRICKECKKIKDKIYVKNNGCKTGIRQKNYALKNKEELTAYKRQWYVDNKSKILEARHIYQKNIQNNIAFKTKRKIYMKKYNSQLIPRIRARLRKRLSSALKYGHKSGSAIRNLGCLVEEVKIWLEQQFYAHPETGEIMTWNNYGSGWHVDHIIPISKVDLTDINQLKIVCNWFNLRPLWAKENLSRGNRIEYFKT
jgi:5-methylcytosine-specific restriction endonuclease McrA